MPDPSTQSFTAFDGARRIAGGAPAEVALAVRAALAEAPAAPVLTFDDATGRVIDLDLRGSAEDIARRLAPAAVPGDEPAEARGRGRPKLGVVAREVTLLPRHWEWLSGQRGGASPALRRLVDEARRAQGDGRPPREAQEAAYRFMSAMAGDLPGFEEAIRALFAADADRLAAQMSPWPADIQAYVRKLALSEPA
jgi:hypothetical protein